jgi:hypothetical protein
MAKQKQSKWDPVLDTANNLNSLWMEFRKSLRKAFSPQDIQTSEEQQFLETKSELSRAQRSLGQTLPEGSHYSGKAISDLMGQCVSIGNIRDLPPTDKKNLYDRWHECYIGIQRLVGTLEIMPQGYPVEFKTAKTKTGNVKADIRSSSGKKKSNLAKNLVAVVIFAAVVAAAYWYMTK